MAIAQVCRKMGIAARLRLIVDTAADVWAGRPTRSGCGPLSARIGRGPAG
jgi:hypothetical protein